LYKKKPSEGNIDNIDKIFNVFFHLDPKKGKLNDVVITPSTADTFDALGNVKDSTDGKVT